MYPQKAPKRLILVLIAVLIFGFHMAVLVRNFITTPSPSSLVKAARTSTATPRPTPAYPSGITLAPKPSPTPTPVTLLPIIHDPGQILGIEGDPSASYTRIYWVRIGYATCGPGKPSGRGLQSTIENYHMQGIRVLLTICQQDGDHLYDVGPLNDAAQSNPDAVQCGNEEMKYDPSVAFLYVQPENFAHFYDLCEHAMHKVRADIPILLGSLDPHVGGIDVQPLFDQAGYLNQVQNAMNSTVHPGGHWNWHDQALGLIDSWHNGYPDSSVNSLYALFVFWAQQFGVDLNSGGLGRHLWVVEGTGCFKGCGIDPTNSIQVAVSHILALITDVQTSTQYGIPFFYFSGKDFIDAGYYWPIGVLDINGHPKPIRQDLRMGDLTLYMSCNSTPIAVINQEDLLSRLYSRCSLPNNYLAVLEY